MKKILLLGLVTSIVVYIILLIMFFRVNKSVSKSFNLIELYISEIERLNALELTLRKTETDIRSYLLSGDESFLDDISSDRAFVDSSISFISGFVKTDSGQVARINELSRLINRRRQLFDSSIERYEKGELQIESVLRLMRLQYLVTSDMRAVIMEILLHERMHMITEKRRLQSLKVQSYSLAASTGFFPMIIAFFTIYFLAGLIRERERMEQKLNSLLSNKDRFLAIIGHDLKGPAGAIKLMAQILVEQKSKMSGEQEQKMKERLLNACSNHVKLLEDLVSWAKTQTQSIEFNPAVIDLRAIVEDAILRITEMALSKNISVFHSFTSGVPVYADEQMIQTVMRNLLQNAVKFTPRGGSVKVEYRILGTIVEISVSDTGVGMPADRVNKLFQPGAEVTAKGTEGETGTGLGLILCKEFIAKHGGRIWVESARGKGSVFYFTLPLLQ